MYPLKMKPVIKDYIWGGTRLIDRYGKKTELSIAAESWEISCHPDGKSTVTNGPLSGQTLADILKLHPEWMGTRCGGFNEFPLLIKFIDAKEPLSLQVHPDDEYANKVEKQAGKNEMWYVMDANQGAELILGFKNALDSGTLERILPNDMLLREVNRIPVQSGDCYCIPVGMLHAIGGGILIAEIQQNSNVTYRVNDYGRKDKNGNMRELHVDKALDVIDTTLQAQKSTGEYLADWKYFKCKLIKTDESIECTCDASSFQCIISTDQEFTIKWDGNAIRLNKGETAFMPAGLGNYMLEGNSRLLLVHM